MLPRFLIYQTLHQHRAWTFLDPQKYHLDEKSMNVKILQNIPLISF